MPTEVIRSHLALIGLILVVLIAATACQSAVDDAGATPQASLEEPTDVPDLAEAPTTLPNPTDKPTAVPEPTAAPATDIAFPTGFDVQGHRGARGLKPENTLPAFEKALDLMVTTLELDLHYSADDLVIIWHDPAINKALCYRDLDAAVDAPDPDSPGTSPKTLGIRQLTRTQLGTYICDRNPDEGRFPDQNNDPTPLAGANYRPVSLAELFDFVAAYAVSPQKSEAQRANAEIVHFNIETKRVPNTPRTIDDDFDGVHAGPFELAILALIADYDLAARVTVQSFDHRSLWAIHAVDPGLSLAALTWGRRPKFEDLVANGATIWSPNYNDLTPDLLEQAHAAGLRVIPWTVNDPAVMQELIALGVDGLISDRPDLLLAPP